VPKAFGWLGGYPLAGFQTGLKQKNPAVCAELIIKIGDVLGTPANYAGVHRSD